MIDPEKLSNIRMATGGEKQIKRVVDRGMLKEWVGIGWVDIRLATPEDIRTYPTTKRK